MENTTEFVVLRYFDDAPIEQLQAVCDFFNKSGYICEDFGDTEPSTLFVREPYSGEAEGIYYYRIDGSLQIIGYSLGYPEGLEEAIQAAFDSIL